MTIQSPTSFAKPELPKPLLKRTPYSELGPIGVSTDEATMVQRMGMQLIHRNSAGSTEFAGGMEAIVEFPASAVIVRYFPKKKPKERFEMQLTQGSTPITPEEAFKDLTVEKDTGIAIMDRSQVGRALRAISNMHINKHALTPSGAEGSIAETVGRAGTPGRQGASRNGQG